MRNGGRKSTGVFGRFSEPIEVRSYQDLLEKLAAIDRPIPGRSEGRSTPDRERDSIVAYLRRLGEAGLLEYPLTIAKGDDPPDFVLRFAGRTRAIEHTNASTPELERAAAQLERSPPGTVLEDEWCGDEAEREWAKIVLAAIQRKVEGYQYGQYDELELLLYDLTLIYAFGLEDGAPFLRESIRSWRRGAGPQRVFSRISVLRDAELLFDVTGRWRVLRPHDGHAPERPPRAWPPQEEIATLCRRHDIRRLSLFGSALRGEDARDSDLDLLVEFEPGVRIGYLGLAGIERELSALFGRSVDLRTPGELGPHLRERVLREAETQYAAS